jgi:radical SAM family RiPP maturation amino acid epimerase
VESLETVQPLVSSPPPADGIPNGHSELYAMFSDDEMSRIVQFKRFRELIEGDRNFRLSLDQGQLDDEQVAFLRRIGITFALDEIALLWEKPEAFAELAGVINGKRTFEELSDGARAAAKTSPLLTLFARFSYLKSKMYARHQDRAQNGVRTPTPEYDAWRKRRVAATKSELGYYGESIDHPVLAIELNVGCSVGCYFCAFDAPRLSDVFDYEVPENRKLFRDVSESFYGVFGPAAGHCLLYWSTEPNDNPHYIDFMKLYREITGSTVCTSTARWSEDWIRGLIEFYRPGAHPWPRISVLSRKIMHRLFEWFTPDEFRDIWLLPQQKDGEEMRKKVPGGRDKMLKILVESEDQRDFGEVQRPDDEVRQGSIACVSGFLVNMIEKTVKLASPCYTTEENRYGYRVFSEATFETAEDFDRAIKDIIERKMVMSPYRTMPMRFRDDLKYRPKEDGFVLLSPTRVHKFGGNEVLRPLGDLLAQGDLDYGQLNARLLEEHCLNPMVVAATIKGLFDKGFLDEVDVERPAA